MGATVTAEGVRFRVWAPRAARVEVVLGDDAAHSVPLASEEGGTWSGVVAGTGAGTRYRYRLNGDTCAPDPYSRWQPAGVHGPSEVVDPAAFDWHDHGWSGLSSRGLVIYQVHVGTASAEGTFDSLIGHLDRIKRLGANAVQTLPIAEFPGTRNWGYDGVNLFAPTRNYGGPQAFKRFVDAAHQRGLGVILDVVYNHFGPDGNYLRVFAEDYFTERYQTPWGEAVNFCNERMRQMVIDNALYWIHEYHVDGLRFDATHAIVDPSERHILQEATEAVRRSLPPEREVVLIAESSENERRYLLPAEQGGHGFDVVYADDLHHALRRYLIGDREGYYADFEGTLAEIARIIEQGWLYEGQPTRSHDRRTRGTPARDRPAWQFQVVLQNHDQVGNRPFGDRLHHQLDLERYRAVSALLLFLPYTPLLFMGQEFAASTPFRYFTDHAPELGRLVTEGRRREFRAFSAFADPSTRESIPDPQAAETFEASKLRVEEAGSAQGAAVEDLYRQLLALRRSDPVIARQERRHMRAETLGDDVLMVHRWSDEQQRLLVVNLGPSNRRVRLPSGAWTILLSTSQRVTTPGEELEAPLRTSVILASNARR